MIKGIGVDIIELDRFNEVNQSFLDKLYTKAEQRLFHGNNYQTLAGNFAAKEAVAKALGTGFSGIAPIEIEVLRRPSGSPYVVLSGNARALLDSMGGGTIHISISHSKHSAVAMAVLEERG
jgi:holo-[acyl-carrier protein] synthase